MVLASHKTFLLSLPICVLRNHIVIVLSCIIHLLLFHIICGTSFSYCDLFFQFCVAIAELFCVRLILPFLVAHAMLVEWHFRRNFSITKCCTNFFYLFLHFYVFFFYFQHYTDKSVGLGIQISFNLPYNFLLPVDILYVLFAFTIDYGASSLLDSCILCVLFVVLCIIEAIYRRGQKRHLKLTND